MGSGTSKPAVTKATRAGAAAAAAASKAATESLAQSSSALHSPPPNNKPLPPHTSSQRAPQPDALTGFYRGQVVSDRERSQEQFWRERQGGGPKEMPPELIKFMRDIGPLKKQEDLSQPTNKNQTLPSSSSVKKKKRAPRGFREEDAKEEAEGRSMGDSSTRRRESMRLVEGIEGFETPRTTNFSTVQEQVDPNDVGVDLLDIYSLLRGSKNNGVVVNSSLDEAARRKQEELFRHTQEYLGLPVLLKDSDGSYIGAWPEKVAQLKEEHKGMHELPKTKAIAVMEDLWEIEQKKKEAA